MSRPAILLVGAGGHARACIDVIEQDGRFDVAGLVGLPAEMGTSILGYPVLGGDEDLPELVGRYPYALVVVGQIKSPAGRIRLFETLEKLNFRLPAIVSSRAYVSRHAAIGNGTIVMHGAIVNAGVVIGRNCIINSLALVEHDSRVGDHTHVSTGALINSSVSIGEGTFVGSGATVRQGASIGNRCVIGMGHRVLADCADGSWVPSEAKPA